MNTDPFSPQRGLSLIEVVVSMLILAVGMIAGLGMTHAGQAGLDAGRRISTAAAFAQAKMEEEISMSYGTLFQGSLAGEDHPEGFLRTWTIQRNAPCPHCLTIRVAVGWVDKKGRNHSTALVTVRTQSVVP
ncbi:MAG TPA: prepilin-type N-terminal cleavage/methylation domain-containing protein [Nitrospiria bacterium]|nr:prepilin-type N-terminal cleavage/methylation domain-containing protein [Nitrospiria bacterium]